MITLSVITYGRPSFGLVRRLWSILHACASGLDLSVSRQGRKGGCLNTVWFYAYTFDHTVTRQQKSATSRKDLKQKGVDALARDVLDAPRANITGNLGKSGSLGSSAT